jgi:hypothetical protein
MDPIFEIVKQLEPGTSMPSKSTRDRQRVALERSINARGGPQAERRSTRRKRQHLRVAPAALAIALVLALSAAGIAAAGGLAGDPPPTPRQASAIYAHYYPNHGAHRTPGTRPPLNSEMVLCDYQHASGLPTRDRDMVGQGLAASAPLTTPLDVRLLLNACSKVAATGDVVPARTPSRLCVTNHASAVTVTPGGWPIVVFGKVTCSASGNSGPPSFLMAQVNQRRNIEVAIDAVPESCPNETQAVDWVRGQLKALSVRMQVDPWSGGPGGRCYLPSVQWWSPPTTVPVVEVTASEQIAPTSGTAAPNTTGSSTAATTPPTTAP